MDCFWAVVGQHRYHIEDMICCPYACVQKYVLLITCMWCQAMLLDYMHVVSGAMLLDYMHVDIYGCVA